MKFYQFKLRLPDQCELLRTLRQLEETDDSLTDLFTVICEPPPAWSEVLTGSFTQQQFDRLRQLEQTLPDGTAKSIVSQLVDFASCHTLDTTNNAFVVSASCGFHPIPVILPMETADNADVQPSN